MTRQIDISPAALSLCPPAATGNQLADGDSDRDRGSAALLFRQSAAIPTRGAAARAWSTITTPKGPHHVWIKRVGNNPQAEAAAAAPAGPALTHEYLEVVRQLPAGGRRRILSLRPARARATATAPDDDDLWTTRALRLRSRPGPPGDRRRPRTISACSATAGAACWRSNMRSPTRTRSKCLVISNMMASIPAYNDYADRGARSRRWTRRSLQADPRAWRRPARPSEPRYMGLLMPQLVRAAHPAPARRPNGPSRSIAPFAKLNRHILRRSCRGRARWARAAAW